jgi:predicted nuclease of predicted toxin-antitoxin system
MKLLFDQNLSAALASLLADVYPGSVHVRDVGLRDAGDSGIWDYAQLNCFTIVFEGLGFSTAEPAAWLPAKIHLAAGWELPDKAYRRFAAKTLRGHSHVRAGSDQVSSNAPVTDTVRFIRY